MRYDSLKYTCLPEEDRGFCGILVAFRRWDTEARGVDGGSGEASEDHQASLVGGM